METDCTYIPYRRTNAFSELVYDYIEGEDTLRQFYHYTPDIHGLEKAIADRKNFPVDRSRLVSVLQAQYAGLPVQAKVNEHITSLLDTDTFTVCTAHQPNLLTGYLYFFYKIFHAIRMAESLKERYPAYRFVPVYYMGSEDNDLEELGRFWYEGQAYNWDAAGQTGAVGRMKTDSLKAILKDLFRRMGPPGRHYDELVALLEKSYLDQPTIAQATQFLVHELFGRYGLVVLNPDDAELKVPFREIMKEELLRQTAFPIVSAQSELLSAQYKAQAYPRPINLFYLKDDIRERIEKQGEYWQVLNTPIRFSAEGLMLELEHYPERFSPNVILRGLFQETILPNICFIGGGAELAYWLQLKPLFERYKVFYPVIYLRQSAQIIPGAVDELMHKANVHPAQIFESKEVLLRKAILEKNGNTWTLAPEAEQIRSMLQVLKQKATDVDPTLAASASALITKMERQVHHLEQKIYRAEKRKEQVLDARLGRLKAQLMPGGGLQERRENFITYYLQEGFVIFEELYKTIKPFDNQFLIFHFF